MERQKIHRVFLENDNKENELRSHKNGRLGLALMSLILASSFTILLSVTIRYFRALKEEEGYIRDAMKLRNIHGMQKIECLLISIMISAMITAEELSDAAITRGIENPAHKTSIVEMRFGMQDFLCLLLSILFCFISDLQFK